MKVNKEVNRIRKEMENENYETLFKNVAGVVQRQRGGTWNCAISVL